MLAGLVARASSPADLAAAARTCRRFHDLAAHPDLLSRASVVAVVVRAAHPDLYPRRVLSLAERTAAARGGPRMSRS
ncbi:unnamed protein product [Urochloa humidicola]